MPNTQIKKASSFSVIVLFLCLTLIGAILIPLLTVRFNQLHYTPSLIVSFNLPNSSARVVEMEVTSKLEGLLARMKGVSDISSCSYNGGGSIRIDLDKHADIDALRLEASAIVRQAWNDFPPNTTYPQVSVNTSDEKATSPFLVYAINAPYPTLQIQKHVEEYLQPALSSLKGISKVNVYGAAPMEWRLTYNPHQLDVLGVTYHDIQNAIKSYYNTEFTGEVNTQQGWCQTIVTQELHTTGYIPLDKIFVKNKDGRILRISELADMQHIETVPQSYYRINGLNSVYLSITAEENANRLTLGRTIKKAVREIRSKMPANYEIHTNYDETTYIHDELKNIYSRCGLTVLILLVFVLLVTRQWRYTLLVATSLTVNILVAVIIYYFGKIDMHPYSLAGITISLSLIIDNTIVMINHILHHRNLQSYMPVLAATLTTILALGSVLFLDEELKNKLQDFAIVVIINLSLSLIVSLFFIPSAINMVKLGKHKRYSRTILRTIVRITQVYETIIHFISRHKIIACITLVLAFGLPVFLLPENMEDNKGWHAWYNKTIGSDYYKRKIRPVVNTVLGGTWKQFTENVFNNSRLDNKGETVLHITATLPNGSTLAQMDQLVSKMESKLKEYKHIRMFQTIIHNAYRASIDIYFPKEYQSTDYPYRLKSDITSWVIEIGGGSWNIYGLEDMGFSNNMYEHAGSYKVKFRGYNYDELYKYCEIFKDRLDSHKRVHDILISSHFERYKNDYREFLFDVSTDRLAEESIIPAELFSSMYGIFSRDIYCGSIYSDNGDNENIILSSKFAQDYTTWQLSYIPLQSDNKTFKLYNLADIGVMPQASEVVKYNQCYELCLQYEYTGNYQMGAKVLERELSRFNKQLPPGYETSAENNHNFWMAGTHEQYMLLGVVVAVIFLVSSILFNSLRKPFAILFVIPTSIIGVFLTFWLFNFNFDQGGFAAIILLCGITVNAAIYLLYEYENIRKRHPLLKPIKAYLKAWNIKIVPISLTILSTILGFIPFIVGDTQERFWFPLAVGTIGGLLMSLVGVFFYLPIYMNIGRLEDKKHSSL